MRRPAAHYQSSDGRAQESPNPMSAVIQARGFVKNSLDKNPTLGHWLDFSVPGKVTLRVGKVDFGQGISTAAVVAQHFVVLVR